MYENLPSQAGVRLMQYLPENVNTDNSASTFKSRLRLHLSSNAFYSVEEFMAHAGT